MQKKEQITIFWGLLIFGATMVWWCGGCADDPEQKASKKLRQAVQAALQQPDRQQASQQIQQALQRYPQARSARPGAYWAQAGLVYQEALALFDQRSMQMDAVTQILDRLAAQLDQIQKLQTEKERITAMLADYDRQAQQLAALLNGTDETVGLRRQIQQAEQRVADLQARQQEIQQRYQALQSAIAARQTQAEQLQRQADVLAGDQQLAVRQQAYQLLLEGQADYLAVQQAEFDLKLLESDLAIAQTQRQAIQEGIERIQAQLAELQNPQAAPLLRQQIQDIETQTSRYRAAAYETADQMTAQLSGFTRWADNTIEQFRRAADLLDNADNSELAFSALMRKADSLTYAGLVCAEKLKLIQRVNQQLAALSGQAEKLAVAGLQERMPIAQRVQPQDVELFQSLFDQSQQSYQQAASQARRLKNVGQEAYRAATSNQLIAMHLKMSLADELKLYDLANQTQTEINRLLAEVSENDADFAASTTAQFLQKGLKFTPTLPINVDLYFESLRGRFTEWKTLPTPQQQAQRVATDLAEINQLVATYGQRMAQLFEGIRQEMLTAQQQGFTTPSPTEQSPTEQQRSPQPAEMMPMMPMMPMPPAQ